MSERVANANLEKSCAYCGGQYPRMYKVDDGTIVCKLGGKCRNGKEQRVKTEDKKNKPLPDVEKALKVRIGDQIIGRIDVVSAFGGGKDYRAFIAHPELGFNQVGVASSQELALKSIGNAIMRKLWEVAE